MESRDDAGVPHERGVGNESNEWNFAERFHPSASAGGTEPSMAVVNAVASATKSDPIDLPPLYDAIEPDALDALFADTGRFASSRSGSVAFEYAGCLVTVSGDGSVSAERFAN